MRLTERYWVEKNMVLNKKTEKEFECSKPLVISAISKELFKGSRHTNEEETAALEEAFKRSIKTQPARPNRK